MTGLPGARKVITVHHAETGIIHHIVRCFEQDMEKQHGPWVGHTFADITGHPEVNSIHPDRHVIDIKTGMPVARTYTVDYHRTRAVRQMTQKCEADVHAAMMQLADFNTARTQLFAKLDAIKSAIAMAPNEAAVKAITW